MMIMRVMMMMRRRTMMMMMMMTMTMMMLPVCRLKSVLLDLIEFKLPEGVTNRPQRLKVSSHIGHNQLLVLL
jgi:hypothetical protein